MQNVRNSSALQPQISYRNLLHSVQELRKQSVLIGHVQLSADF